MAAPWRAGAAGFSLPHHDEPAPRDSNLGLHLLAAVAHWDEILALDPSLMAERYVRVSDSRSTNDMTPSFEYSMIPENIADDTAVAPTPALADPGPKRRGRPRGSKNKRSQQDNSNTTPSGSATPHGEGQQAPKRPRGRPRQEGSGSRAPKEKRPVGRPRKERPVTSVQVQMVPVRDMILYYFLGADNAS